MLHNTWRHEISKIFGSTPCVCLHDDANDFSVYDDRAAAITRVYSSVNLTGQQVSTCVGIHLLLNARQDALGNAEGFAAYRVAVDGHFLQWFGQVTNAESLQVTEKAGLIYGD